MNKTQSAVALVGAALIAGFFLPWYTFFGHISGWNMVVQGQGEYLSRLAVLAVPLLGAMLLGAGLNRSRAAGSLGVLTGVGILGYIGVRIAWDILMNTGVGLWLVLGGAVAAIVVGVSAQKSPR
jgi:hypothetical protein